MGRDRDVADAGVGLRQAHDHLAVDTDDRAPDLDPIGAQVDITSSELGELTEAHRAPGRKQCHQLVPVGQLRDDRLQLIK